jgi:hypothetical protein
MFIDKNQRRVNIHAPYLAENGTVYVLTEPSSRQEAGVTEIADPVPPEDYSEATYYRNEIDDAPYVIYTKKSDEQLETARKGALQAQIDSLEQSALMPRATREFMLLSMESMFSAEQLAQNPGYKAVKAFDAKIAELRSQL